MGRISFSSLTSRDQILRDALGFYAESSPLISMGAATALAAQSARFTSIALRAGDVVSNIVVCVSTAASGTAGVANVALYNSASVLKASSGNVQANLAIQGLQACALTVPYVVPTVGIYYCAVLMTTAYGTTQPTLGGNSLTGASVALSGKSKVSGIQTSQSSLPDPAALADSGVSIWFGVS